MVAELFAMAKNYTNADDAEKLIREDVRGIQQNEQPPRQDDTRDNRERFDNPSLRYTDNETTEQGGIGAATAVMISGVNNLATTTTKST